MHGDLLSPTSYGFRCGRVTRERTPRRKSPLSAQGLQDGSFLQPLQRPQHLRWITRPEIKSAGMQLAEALLNVLIQFVDAMAVSRPRDHSAGPSNPGTLSRHQTTRHAQALTPYLVPHHLSRHRRPHRKYLGRGESTHSIRILPPTTIR